MSSAAFVEPGPATERFTGAPPHAARANMAANAANGMQCFMKFSVVYALATRSTAGAYTQRRRHGICAGSPSRSGAKRHVPADETAAGDAGESFGLASVAMAFIKTVPVAEATGLLARQYKAAVARTGRVFNVIRLQSLNPRLLDASVNLYETVMLGPSSLSRAEREMIAVVVSRENECFY